jgi:putative ABC transport system permease protein
MTWLAFATLRSRKGGFLGAFTALFCAAALVCGCGLLFVTGLLGSTTPERYAGAPLLVAGDQNVHETSTDKGKTKVKSKPITDRAWVEASLADRLASLHGVGAVITEVTFAAYLPGGRSTESWGHGWGSAALGGFTLSAGRAPQASDEIVLDATTAHTLRLSPGSAIRILTAAGEPPCRVVGVTAQGTPDESTIFFTNAQARKLAGHAGLVSAIGVFPATGVATQKGAAEVRTALAGTGATVHTGEDRGAAEFLGAATARVRLISIAAVLASTSLIVALLVVTGTLALSIQQRQRELAVLRAVAATPRQIRKLIGGEALLVGLLGAPLGAAAGLLVGVWLHSRFVAFGFIPANLRLVLSPFPVIGAVLATLLAAWGAARVSARRANRIPPVEALGEAELTPPNISFARALSGILAAAGALTLTILLSALHSDAASAPVSLLATLLWCTALALLGPVVATVAVAVLALPLRVSRVGGFLAAANLRTAAHRLASVITPLALLVAMACTILFTHTTMDYAAAAQTSQGTQADYILGPLVDEQAVAAVKSVPGVRAVTEEIHATVRDGLTARTVLAVSPANLTQNLDLQVETGTLGALSTTTMAVASSLGYHIGDKVRLVLPDGVPVTLEVVAEYGRDLGFGNLVLDRDLVAAHVDVPLDSELLADAPGVSREAIAAAAHIEPGVSMLAQTDAAAGTTVSTKVGYVSLGLILAFTAIAVLNTLAMTIAERRREFASLRLAGATPGQVLGMLRWETGATVFLAALFGSGIGISVLTTYAVGMTGRSAPSVPLTWYGAVLATTVLLAALATWLPARIVLAKGEDAQRGRRTRARARIRPRRERSPWPLCRR